MVAALLAASVPERAGALVGVAAGAHAPLDYGSPEQQDRFFAGLEKYWGREDAPFNYWAPKLWRDDPSFDAGGPGTAALLPVRPAR